MPGGSIGTIYYDVLPEMGRFGAAVAAQVGGIPPAKIKVDADTAGAKAGISQLTGANSALEASSRKLANAQGTLRVANARLGETQAKAAQGSARLISAQESQARAMRNVITAQREVAAASAAANPPAEKLFTTLGRNIDNPSIQRLGTGLLAVGAGLAVGVGAAVKVTADFEQAVSHVAATGAEAKRSISDLRAEAVKYGASTSFSAKEAANAQEELIKANVSVTDTIKGGLKGALDLAAAGSLGVADAAGIMGTAMSQFKLPGTQASHVADLLAAAAGKAQGEVGDFAEALKYVGPIAHSSGVSIEETTGVLAEFANQGILGSQAGTSLRGILVGLTAPSKVGSAVMKEYGINVRDAAGNFIGFEGAAGELQRALSGVSDAERDAALSRIFGRNSLTAATALYEGGAGAVRDWTKSVNDSGFAQRVAAEKMNNLKGDIEKLGGAFQSLAIGAAGSSQGPLRSIVQGITGVVDAVGKLNPRTLSTLFAGVGATGGAALFAGGLIKVAGAAKEAKLALDVLKISTRTALLGAGALGIGLGVAAFAVGHWAAESAKAKAAQDDFNQALIASNGAIDQNIISMRAKQLEETGAIKAANDLGIKTEDLTAASFGNAEAQGRVNAALAQAEAQGTKTGRSINGVSLDYNRFSKQMETVRREVGNGAQQYDAAKTAQERYAASVEAGTDAMGMETEAHKQQQASVKASITAVQALQTGYQRTAADGQKLAQSLFTQGDAAQSITSAYSNYQQAIDGAGDSIGKHTLKIDRNTGLLASNTEKQRQSASALLNLASAGKSYVTGLAAQGAGSAKLQSATAGVRKSFIEAARAGGLGAKAAARLADSYGLIPSEVKTKFEAVGIAIQQAKVAAYQKAIEGLTEEQRTKVSLILEKQGAAAAEKYLRSLMKPIKPPVDPTLRNPGDVINKLDKFGNPIKPPVKPTLNPGNIPLKLDKFGKPIKPKVSPSLKDSGITQKLDKYGKPIKKNVNVAAQGVPAAQRKINSVKDVRRQAILAARGVPQTQSKINGVKGVRRDASLSAKGVPATQSKINSVHGVSRTVHVTASGIAAAQARINAIRGGSVSVSVKTGKRHADGGPVKLAAGGRPDGGRIVGRGGPRQDNIAGIDAATGIQTALVSVGEFVTNAAAYAANRRVIETINAGRGRRFDIVPLRNGGPARGAVSTSSAPAKSTRSVALTVNIYGGNPHELRRVIEDVLAEQGEFESTINGMRH